MRRLALVAALCLLGFFAFVMYEAWPRRAELLAGLTSLSLPAGGTTTGSFEPRNYDRLHAGGVPPGGLPGGAPDAPPPIGRLSSSPAPSPSPTPSAPVGEAGATTEGTPLVEEDHTAAPSHVPYQWALNGSGIPGVDPEKEIGAPFSGPMWPTGGLAGGFPSVPGSSGGGHTNGGGASGDGGHDNGDPSPAGDSKVSGPGTGSTSHTAGVEGTSDGGSNDHDGPNDDGEPNDDGDPNEEPVVPQTDQPPTTTGGIVTTGNGSHDTTGEDDGDVHDVPEPATIVLLGLGICGAASRAARQRR